MREEQGVGQQSVYRQGIKEVLPSVLYPFIYLLIVPAVIAIHICGAIPSVHKTNFKLQWLIYNIILYIDKLFVPVICLLYLSIVSIH